MSLIPSGDDVQKHQIETLVSHYFQNETYNLTDSEYQNILNYIRTIRNKNNDTILLDEIDTVNCGDKLKHWSQIYAKHVHPYLAIVVCLIGIITNITNVVVLTRKEMVCTPVNRILTSLATTDIFLMVDYIPYVYYHYLVLPKTLDFPFIGAVYMLFHVHFTQTLHTTSICLTLLLAVWRYLALRYPNKKRILCSEFRCTLGISLSFILPVILSIPTYVTFTIRRREILEDNVTYILYHTDLRESFKYDRLYLQGLFWVYGVFLKLLPCVFLTVITFWLIKTLLKAKKQRQVVRTYDQANEIEIDCRLSKSERCANRTTKMLVIVLFLFLITEIPQGIFALLIGIKGKQLFLKCYQIYGELMDIFALVSGAVSFILYCRMNTMFRITFGQLCNLKFARRD
ncbi:probable G-protein coupled receptor B0563.6 isoform X1 [Tribolium castaneum]|uniref:CG13229-like G protein-coupled receptor n=1 Tax=Tribolium castaneum TaxID=7070 RepID=D6X512_TRICA|nr:probable G-protein coupled receptor B0563.6 [Tribolium castaneum]XP_015839626.1 PREDICTED: probable G-protein coupled receptor B0563.6 isoform X1 [Tribolium castaneum]DAA64474.1 TPA_inf: CG13229-like G protein-coupled receptor [Tribolium castaneum]|eukprot:NP_001280662.1 probable G-protein coupled receptor B0563.6 [Tribolium castaneum]